MLVYKGQREQLNDNWEETEEACLFVARDDAWKHIQQAEKMGVGEIKVGLTTIKAQHFTSLKFKVEPTPIKMSLIVHNDFAFFNS